MHSGLETRGGSQMIGFSSALNVYRSGCELDHLLYTCTVDWECVRDHIISNAMLEVSWTSDAIG